MEDCLLTSTKEFVWDMAHMLSGHQGLCKNLHGHTYKMEVTACQQKGHVYAEGPSAGMVVDFKDLKTLVSEVIVAPLDHATMISTENPDSFEQDLMQLLETYNKKYVKVSYRPTAENMAYHFLQRLNEAIEERQLDFYIVRVRIYETPTSYSEIMS